MTHQYSITGMTCSNCTARVKSELLKLGDVISAEVQLQLPQATINMSKHIPVETLQQTVTKAGQFVISEADGGMSVHANHMDDIATEKTSYFPIFLIFTYITGISVLIQVTHGSFNPMKWMSHFMAGFFLVFSFFKLMNIRSFAEGYSSYDVVAKKIPAWGFVYPFVELGLGLFFLTGLEPLGTNIVTFIVMGVSCIGVIQSLLKKTSFHCACLGTVIKLPLGKVTLFEDLLMAIMSAIMIYKLIAS